MIITDSGLHVWQPSTPERPWDTSRAHVKDPISYEDLRVRMAEAGVHRVVERVQPVGPVERDREDGAVAGYFDFHSGLLFSTNALRPSRASSDANAR